MQITSEVGRRENFHSSDGQPTEFKGTTWINRGKMGFPNPFASPDEIVAINVSRWTSEGPPL